MSEIINFKIYAKWPLFLQAPVRFQSSATYLAS